MERMALESLAGFLDRLSDPDLAAGKWITPAVSGGEAMQMPYVQYAAPSSEFIQAAYDHNWLAIGFDWTAWATSPEAMQLMNEPAALAKATPEELSKLLTVCIRRDRFVEGSLLDDFECGLILRIVQRAAKILSNTPSRKLSNQQAGGLGELLALAKLNSLGVAAYMSPEGAPGHDLIAIVGGEAKSIEVKTRQFFLKPTEITRWPVDLGTKGDADFFLFVELDLGTMSPTFYLLTNGQAHQTNKNFGVGQGNCYPAQVRSLVERNDFSALFASKAKPSQR